MTIQRRFIHPTLPLTLALLTFVSFAEPRVIAAAPAPSADERIAKVKSDLQNTDPAVRRSAISSLVHSDISAKLLPEIRTALEDRDGNVRSVAATAVGNVGVTAVPAIPQLIAQLKSDPVKEARETAARALGRIGKAAPDEKQLITPLRDASQNDADPVTRVVAHGALAMINVELPEQITALRKYLHHDDALVRMKASHALGMLGKAARAAAPEIAEVLRHETDGHRRGYVARALGSTGDPASLPVLEAALEKETDAGAKGEMRGAINRLKALASESTTQPAPLMNTLTDAEKAAGWKLLFDGKTTTGWRGFGKKECPPAWQVIDGALDRVNVKGGGGDIITVDMYDSFDLILDWRISRKGNSGVMYHVTEEETRPAWTGPEVQILDNIEGEDPQRAGWCYALYAPPIDAKTGKPLDTTKPVGQWNTMRILIDGPHVEHWMNGVKYVEYELWSDDWNQRVAKTKFAAWPKFGKAKSGFIDLQDHGGEVAFRNIKIRVIKKQ